MIWDFDSGPHIFGPVLAEGNTVNAVCDIAISPDEQVIASGYLDGTVKVWDMHSRAVLTTLKEQSEKITSVSFSPDGKHIVSASRDSTLKIWDWQAGSTPIDLRGHSSAVLSASYSPDGSQIVSADANARIIIWESRTGNIIRRTATNDDKANEEGEGGGDDRYDVFPGWKLDGGWVIGRKGEYRLWLPKAQRSLVKDDGKGLSFHRKLNFPNCNGAAEDYKGFVLANRKSSM